MNIYHISPIQRVVTLLRNYKNTFIAMCIIGMSISTASASVIEIGDTNLIQDALNPSDGLYFLDTTYSDGLTMVEALGNAKSLYSDARIATPAEWNNLFLAAGISYTGSLTASAAFDFVDNQRIARLDSNVGMLNQMLSGNSDSLYIWSDPDGLGRFDATSTIDFILLGSSFVDIRHASRIPGDVALDYSWLIVSDSGVANVPAPDVIWLFGSGLIGLVRRRKKLAILSGK